MSNIQDDYGLADSPVFIENRWSHVFFQCVVLNASENGKFMISNFFYSVSLPLRFGTS